MTRARRLIPLALAVAALLLLATAVSASAADYYVTDTSDSGTSCSAGTGSNCTLREAFGSVSDDDTIHVASGHYTLTKGELYFAGRLTVVGDSAKNTIVDGNGVSRIFEFDSGPDTVRNLKVTGGNGKSGASAGNGGGILSSSDLTLDHVAVTDNHTSSTLVGGGVDDARGQLTILDSEISDNSTDDGNGGGINGANVTVTNSTVSANHATGTSAAGGGVYVRAQASLLDDTIAGNSVTVVPPTEQAVRAPVSRSGAGVALGDGDAVTLENTILSANTTTMNGGSPFSDNCNMAFASGDYNIADDSSCGLSGTHDRENTDPKLGALADNGGQTRTQAIATDSPAFDGADGNDCPAKVNHDQRDISRPQSAACDVGAFELQQAQTASSADLALTKTVSPGSVTVGKNVSFLLTANNAGPNDATNTRVTDTLPSGLTFVSANPSQGSCSGTSTVTCALGTVRSSGTASVTIVARVSAVGTFTNSADVTADPSDPNPSNNSASARVTGKPPAAQGRLSLQVSATRGCVRTTARINVRVTAPAGIRTVRVTIDGKVDVRSKRSKFIVYVKRGALRVGPNPVKVVVTDRRGRSATRRPTLTRCRVRRAPSFTG